MSHNGMSAESIVSYASQVNANRVMPAPKKVGLLPFWELGLNNPLLDVDSYKASMFCQYPPGTEQVYSYVESRGTELGNSFNKVMFFGLQAYLKRYLSRPITVAQIDEAQTFWAGHGLPFDRSLWMHIIEKHDGRLPLEIRALPEGTVVPMGTPMLTITNTDPACFWLVTFLETALLRAVWYPSTVATISHECKRELRRAYERTSDEDLSGVLFKLHDFGARGVSSQESAALGGMAHLVNFMGSDTVSGILAARQFYGEEMAGFSIPAAEHSTITSWGKDHELDAYRNMLDMFGDRDFVAIVADSYDVYSAAAKLFGGELRNRIMDQHATVVVRPDSGDPHTTPIAVLRILDEKFGHTVNSKGFRVLNPSVRVIQGDGINIVSLHRIIHNLELNGYAIDNIAFGMGGGLLQHCNRDTFKFAMKCSAAKVNGEWRDVFKAPIGQPDKSSKKGRFSVVRYEGKYHTIPEGSVIKGIGSSDDLLQPVWRNGDLIREHTFSGVRTRSEDGL